eukprot:gene11804-5138_t
MSILQYAFEIETKWRRIKIIRQKRESNKDNPEEMEMVEFREKVLSLMKYTMVAVNIVFAFVILFLKYGQYFFCIAEEC